MNHTTSGPESLGFPSVTRALAVLAGIWLSAGCGGDATKSPDPGPAGDELLVLVAFDGFRWDYPERGVSPNLSALEERGVRAEGLIPSFPTKTFPNHYTMVTGLVPDRHGIIANTMWDPELKTGFSMSNREQVQNGAWWGGEPVWVPEERAGRPTAPLFWPGNEAEINGFRPSYWLPFDGAMPNADRVDWLMELLDRPTEERPRLLTLYLDETDISGHDHGPDSPETLEAIRIVDEALGLLVQGLEKRGLLSRTNLVVVSDHGMIPTSRERVFFVDDYVNLDTARVIDWDPVLALWPDEEHQEAIYGALKDAHPHVSIYWKDSIPERFDYGKHPRVPPIIGIADDGWTITTRPYYEEAPIRADGGNHGFDHEARDMQGIFVAAGPAFHSGLRVPAFRNVDVYPLLMKLLDLPAAPGDGDPARVEDLLAD